MPYVLFQKADDYNTPLVVNSAHIVCFQQAGDRTAITMAHGVTVTVLEDIDTVLKSLGFHGVDTARR